MKTSKKIVILMITFLLVLTAIAPEAYAYQVISDTSEKQELCPGVTLEKVTTFTTDGWLSMNIMRVNLDNPYIKAKALSSNTSVKNLEPMTKLAAAPNTIGAVNGSFFIWWKEAGLATPIGYSVEDGQLTTGQADFNTGTKDMANIIIGKDKTASIAYMKFSGKLTAPNGISMAVGRVNKPFYGHYTDLTIQDKNYSATSEKVYTMFKDFVEMVVENDTVKEIRQCMPATEIPANGYVVTARADAGKYLVKNFKVGDPVVKELNLTPDLSLIDQSITGGTQLVKDGKKLAKFTFVESGRNPQTAIGITKDKKNLILFTVDGRQKKSIGMTLDELAAYMIKLGAYSAIAFDSGGSTEMVAKLQGDSKVTVQNSPSDGSQRSVINGFGIVSTAKTGTQTGLLLSAYEENVFVNASRSLTIVGHDVNYNPVAIKSENIKWTVSGVKGTIKNNVFYPTSTGEAKITAKLGNFSATTTISVLSSPVRLSVSDRELELIKGESGRISVTGYNKTGYSASIAPNDIKWSVGGVKGTFAAGKFTSTQSGMGYIKAAFGSAAAYTMLNIENTKTVYSQGFEADCATFSGYPQTVTGSLSISNETAVEGTNSGKLSFDFSKDISKARAAYVVFNDKNITIPEDALKLSVNLKSDFINSCSVKAEIIDRNGKSQLVTLTKGFKDKNWKNAEFGLSGVSLPAKLTKLYVVEESPVPDVGSIYFDNLQVIKTVPNSGDNKYESLKDVTIADSDMKNLSVTSNSNSFSFSVFPQMDSAEKEQESMVNRTYTKMQKESELGAFPGGLLSSTRDKSGKYSLSFKKLLDGSGNTSVVYKNSLIVQLDIGKTRSLRLTSKSGWSWLLNTLRSYKGNNIFIVSDTDPFNFSDSNEGQLLRKTLTDYAKKGKKIYFTYPDDSNKAFMSSGVKYLPIQGLGSTSTSRLRIVVKNGTPYYWYNVEKK